MAAEHLTRDPVLRELALEPWRFEFPQAIRILLKNSRHGRTGRPRDRRFDLGAEPVRIGAHQSMGFPASDIQALTFSDSDVASSGQSAKMLINFLGLTGPSGVLPLCYTEYLIDKGLERIEAPAAFFDLFNHRLAMLFYYAWEKYRFPVTQERRPEHDVLATILLSLEGLGTEHLKQNAGLAPSRYLPYTALLAMQQRSAWSLEAIITDYFKVPVEVQQFAGIWYHLAPDSITRMSGEAVDSERLGYGIVVSDEYWSQEFMVRVRIGPLDLDTFRLFLGDGANRGILRDICRFYARDELAFELQLVLDKNAVPETVLRDDGSEQGSQLGWTTWAKTIPFADHAGDVVVRLT